MVQYVQERNETHSYKLKEPLNKFKFSKMIKLNII